MNNFFYEMIFKRKSFHIFRNVGNESIGESELNEIQKAYSAFTPMNPGIKTAIRIVPEKQTNCKRGGEYCVLLYSEKKDGYLQNVGSAGSVRSSGRILRAAERRIVSGQNASCILCDRSERRRRSPASLSRR